MRAAELGFEAAGQLLIHQDGVEMHRGFGNAHALTPGRDAGMQVSQRFRVIEPFGLRHEALDQRQNPVGAVNEACQRRAPIGAVAGAALVEPGLGTGGVLGRRQPDQRQKIPALEMRTFFLELRAALRIDQTRGCIGEFAFGVAIGRQALGLDEDRPAGAETAQRVVQATGDGDQFRRRRGVQVRPAKPRGALEGAVLVEDDAFLDQSRPRQEVSQALAVVAVFGEVHHGAASRHQMLRVAQVPAHDIDEGGIALGGPDGGQMADQPDGAADDPEAQSQAHSGGERAI